MAREGSFRLEVMLGSIPVVPDFWQSPTAVNIGGLQWYLRLQKETSARTNNVNTLMAFLACDNKNAKYAWKCRHRNTITMINHINSEESITKRVRKEYSADVRSYGDYFGKWSDARDLTKGFVSDGKLCFEANIIIVKTNGVREDRRMDFSQQNELSDVSLVVEGEMLFVSKTMLAVHSPVFKAMFFGRFEEAKKKEVPIKEVEHSDFIDFLNVLYTSVLEIADENVEKLLVLADRFQVKYILEAVEAFLVHSSKLKTTKKLQLSEAYKLDALEEHLLRSFTKIAHIKALEDDFAYHDLSDYLLARLQNRTIELIPKETATA